MKIYKIFYILGLMFMALFFLSTLNSVTLLYALLSFSIFYKLVQNIIKKMIKQFIMQNTASGGGYYYKLCNRSNSL